MSDDEHDGPKAAFKVQDRRRFSASGEARDEAEAPPVAEAPAAPSTLPPADEPASLADEAGIPALTFTTFVMSLVTQTLALLGEIPDPASGAVHVELSAARQLIDILAILSEKTRGNLDAGEAALLDAALYDLRMQYVERSKSR
jgi:Domain of unknown function (DUF1844)